MQPTIASLRARVKGPNEADWGELVKLMKRLNGAAQPRVQGTHAASSDTRMQVLLSIPTAKVTQALLHHLKMARARCNLSQESKDSAPRAAQNPNSLELTTHQS